MRKYKVKVTHIVPFDGIGGVETAAKSMVGRSSDKVDFELNYIYSKPGGGWRRIFLFSPIPVFFAILNIFRSKPDLLIVSLWRSCVVGVLAKLLRPKVKLILFLHMPKNVHFVDFVFTGLARRLAKEIWADSEDTLTSRFPQRLNDLDDNIPTRIISFVTKKFLPVSSDVARPSFIFWGRLHSQKGLEKALQIFALVSRCIPEANYTIIGPNGGELSKLKKQVQELGCAQSVQFTGAKNIKQIQNIASKATFYLQTSLVEGMAMSVVEAMQLGLVPIVTPVGEISRYCQQDQNALIVSSQEKACIDILEVINNDARYKRLRDNAITTWAEAALYSESFLDACEKA